MENSISSHLSRHAKGCLDEQLISVLCVDDETIFLENIKKRLELQGGFQVEVASSVNDALQKMSTKAFDAVVSDDMMPEKTGLDFLKELRENKKQHSIHLIHRQKQRRSSSQGIESWCRQVLQQNWVPRIRFW